MSAFVGKQVVLLVHKAAKLFLYCDKKEKKSFVLFAALHYSFFCILIPFTTFMSFGDRFPYCISLFKATFLTTVLQGSNYVCVMRKLYYKKKYRTGPTPTFFSDYYCNLAQLNLFLHQLQFVLDRKRTPREEEEEEKVLAETWGLKSFDEELLELQELLLLTVAAALAGVQQSRNFIQILDKFGGYDEECLR